MERLRQYLSDNEITQAEFADRIGVKQPTVWEWVNGKSKPSADRLQVIARETHISIDDLLDSLPRKTTAA